MANKKIFFDILVNVKSAKENLEALNQKISGVKNRVLALASAFGISFGFTHLVRHSIENFFEFERTLARFSQTLLIAGQYHKETINQMLKQQAELQKQFAINDEAIRETQNLFLYFDIPLELIQDLTKATAMFAKALEMDIGTAGFIVAKSIGGATNMLSRYGVEFKKTGDMMRDTINAIESLTTRFAGAGESVFFSHQKYLQRLQLAWEDTLENIGGFIVKFLDKIVGFFSPTYKTELQFNQLFSDLIIKSQSFYTAGKSEALKNYAKKSNDELQKILSERKELLKKYESDVNIFRAEYKKLIAGGGDKQALGYLESKYLPSINSYQKLRGEIEAINYLIDEITFKESERKKKIEEEEKKYKEYLNNISLEFKYLKAKNELTDSYLEKLKKTILIEQERAEKTKNYATFIELNELLKEIENILSERINFRFAKVVEDFRGYVNILKQIPKELKSVEFEEFKLQFEEKSPYQIIREALYNEVKTFIEQFTGVFEYSEIIASDYIQSIGRGFNAVVREIENSFFNMWNRVFGQANSLLEIFLQNFISGIIEALTKFAVFEFMSAVFGITSIGFLHKGGIVKAHSGILTRDEVPIIARKGEMILNERQQGILWNMINNQSKNNFEKQIIYISIDGEIISKKLIEKKLPSMINKLNYVIR